MDLAAAKADGITGFSHKATEGTSITHTHTGEALNRARNAGMEFIGAYHVVRSVSTSAQVNYFLSYLDQVAPWWRSFPGFFLQVDLELWPYDQVSAATGISFASQLVAAQPKRVITYASRGQYGNTLNGIVTPLWNAAYGNDPAIHYPGAYPGDGSSNWAPYSGWTPVFWQYGSQLRIGNQPTCDCSAYRGTLDDLRQLIVGRSSSAPSEEDDMRQVLVRYTDAPSRDGTTPGYLRVFLADGMRQRELPPEFFVLPPGGLLAPRPGIVGNDGTHEASMLGNLGNGGQIFLVGPGGWAQRSAWGAVEELSAAVSAAGLEQVTEPAAAGTGEDADGATISETP